MHVSLYPSLLFVYMHCIALILVVLVFSPCCLTYSASMPIIASSSDSSNNNYNNTKCKFSRYLLSHDGNNNNARCLDGSPPAFYISKPATPSSNWILYFESGGWCYDTKACYERSLTSLGSSKVVICAPYTNFYNNMISYRPSVVL
jgi:hypothetical protein